VRFYDRSGAPITDAQWLAAMADDRYRTVGLHLVRGLVVSTSWLGFDASPDLGETDFGPFLFETMVTELGTGALVEVRRYRSITDARQGHAELIELATAPGAWRRFTHQAAR
jgi:hypothetical protein